MERANGSRFFFYLWKSNPDSWKSWDTRFNTKTPTLVILLFRHFSFFYKCLVFSLYLKQLFEKYYTRFLHQQFTAFQIQLLFPCCIVDAVISQRCDEAAKIQAVFISEMSLTILIKFLNFLGHAATVFLLLFFFNSTFTLDCF